jgi:hypothetical protein
MGEALQKAAQRFRQFQVRWVDRLQGDLVLPTARTLYLAGAFGALGAVMLGLLAAIWFQFASLRPMPSVPAAPPPISGPVVMDLTAIDARLAPPSNVRFVLDREIVTDTLNAGELLGHFEADTPNGLDAPPDDFQLIGGRDDALFETTAAQVRASGGGERQGTVLRASPELAARINAARVGLAASTALTFQIRVVAGDRHGDTAPPQLIAVNLTIGPPGTPPPAPVAAPVQTVTAADTPLTRLAREIALIVDPARTATYFEAFDRASAEPATCGADEASFVPQYRLAFDRERPRLKASNIEAFYSGLCDAWSVTQAQRQQVQDQAQMAWAARATQAQAAQIETAAKKAISRTLRNLALLFVAGALLTFMTISVLLAFMAIEGHSQAVRQVVELLAAQNAQSLSERRP